MPMWKRMNEEIMEKVLDFLEDKSILWLGCDGDIYKWQGQEDRK